MFTNKYDLVQAMLRRIDEGKHRPSPKTAPDWTTKNRLETRGWLSKSDFDTLATDLSESDKAHFEAEWAALERRIKGDRWFASLASNRDLALLFQKVKPRQRDRAWREHGGEPWADVARALLRNFGEEDWPDQYTIHPVLQRIVLGIRFQIDELTALKYALILALGLMARGRHQHSTDRIVVVSAIYYVVAFGGSTGHQPALYRAQMMLEVLNTQYPQDLHVLRLLLDAKAILQSHKGRRSRTALENAIQLHTEEVAVMRQTLGERGLAQDSRLLCRAGTAAVINQLNLFIRAGRQAPFVEAAFGRWRTDEMIVDELAPDDGPAPDLDRVRPWRDPEHPEFLANIKLVRLRRGQSLVGGDPAGAAEIIQRVFDAHKVNPNLSLLERGDLGDYLTEAQLCRYADGQITKAEYLDARRQTLADYRGARLENMAQRVIQRMAPLEALAGLTPSDLAS